ncbi:MAG: TlpA disulfide reductase family protein, partial [Pelobium sp.]
MHTILVLFLGFTCQMSFSASQTLLSAELPTFPTTPFKVLTNQSSLNSYKGELLSEGSTDEKGRFSVAINIPSEQPVTLYIGNSFFKLWITPGTSLSIKESGGREYIFAGPMEKQNSFLFKSGLMKPSTLSMSGETKDFNPGRVLRYFDSIQNRRFLLYTETFSAKAPSSKFDSYARAEITHFSLVSKSQYPAKYIYVDKTLAPRDIPDGYYSFWLNFNLHEDSCMSDHYQNSVSDFIEYRARKKLPPENQDMESLWQEEFNVMDSLLSELPLTMQKQKTHALMFLAKYADFPNLVKAEMQKYFTAFPKSASSSILKNAWEAKAKNILETVSFHLKDANGNSFRIENLRGKVVYVDFWGVWCKACVDQMPNSKKLQSKFKGRDVSFVFIDFYDTKEKWLSYIKYARLEGIHLKTETTDEIYFDKMFGVKEGFPRYALIDKKGRLITSSAPP